MSFLTVLLARLLNWEKPFALFLSMSILRKKQVFGQINIYPRANVVISATDEAALRQRNQHIKSINQDGVLAWRRTSGYYRQSEVENMFFRYKKLIGDELRAINEDSRRVESVIACNIQNQFRLLGSPQSTLVA